MLTKMFKALATLVLFAAATFAFCKACTYETKAVEPMAEKPIVYEQKPEAPERIWTEDDPPFVVPTASTPIYAEEKKPFVRFSSTNEVYITVNGIPVTYKELHMLGLTIWGEANGQSKMEQAAVAWSILNRVDEEGYARGKSLSHVITFPGQFHGYKNTKGARCTDYYLELAKDVVDRWAREHNGEENVGRVLPKEYTFFVGKKTNGEWHNYFRTAYKTNEPRWDWSLPNPYEETAE